MNAFRVFCGEDSQSYLEALGDTHDLLTQRQDVKQFFLKRFPAGTSLDKHPAPRKMITIIIQGTLELQFGDGTIRQFVPGDIRFMEDTESEGHFTRVIGDQDVVIAVASYP